MARELEGFMPFGEYEARNCENPDCGKRFTPGVPWQRHCQESCRNHCVYLRVVLPKRIQRYEKRLLAMSGSSLGMSGRKAGKANRLKLALESCRKQLDSLPPALAPADPRGSLGSRGARRR